MEETKDADGAAPKKRSRLPLVLGLVLGLAGAGGGFYAVYSGMLLAPKTEVSKTKDVMRDGDPLPSKDTADIAFIPVEPLVISLNGSENQHLRFRAQLEVKPGYKSEVEHLMPRVVDVLNSYLRAIDLADLRENAALVRLRAQMLRRVQVVTGDGKVNDLLIMEFVLN